jgi:hypothetical protein
MLLRVCTDEFEADSKEKIEKSEKAEMLLLCALVFALPILKVTTDNHTQLGFEIGTAFAAQIKKVLELDDGAYAMRDFPSVDSNALRPRGESEAKRVTATLQREKNISFSFVRSLQQLCLYFKHGQKVKVRKSIRASSQLKNRCFHGTSKSCKVFFSFIFVLLALIAPKGMAAGAGVSYDMLLLENLEADLVQMLNVSSIGKCSDVTVSRAVARSRTQRTRMRMCVLIVQMDTSWNGGGHNEDDDIWWKNLTFLLNYRDPHARVEWWAFTYAAQLPGNAFGWTRSGNFISVNSLFPTQGLHPRTRCTLYHIAMSCHRRAKLSELQ